MKKYVCLCPYCEHLQYEEFVHKATIVCNECNRPYESYSDGRNPPSNLYLCKGLVYIDSSLCSGFGKKTLRTYEDDIGVLS